MPMMLLAFSYGGFHVCYTHYYFELRQHGYLVSILNLTTGGLQAREHQSTLRRALDSPSRCHRDAFSNMSTRSQTELMQLTILGLGGAKTNLARPTSLSIL